jgi:HK97 family phage major capsid protein
MDTLSDIIARLREDRAAALAAYDDLVTTALNEDRDLTEAEVTRKDALKAEIETIDDRTGELAEMRDAASKAEANMAALAGASQVKVTAEPRTYNPEVERRGTSFLRDVANQRQDPQAADRLVRHMREAQDHELRDFERRDVGTGAFAGLTVPQYLTDLVAPIARAGRPVLDICNQHPLPDDGMVVNISRITTGSGVAAQSAENAAVTETNMDDTLLTVNVNTYAGMQDVSRQAVDRGTGIDSIVIADLVRAYNTVVDAAVLNADGTGGTHLGIRSTAGIIAVTYTDASPTAAELYPKLFDLIQQIQAGVFMGVTHFIMHPRRFWWVASQVGTSFPFLQFFSNAPQTGGQVDSRTYGQGPSGNIGGVPVIVDGNIPTNLGGGTNEDVIIGVDANELHFWSTPDAPLFIRSDEVLSNQLSVRFVLYGYSAFTAGRYPAASGTIGGTGLVTPTF